MKQYLFQAIWEGKNKWYHYGLGFILVILGQIVGSIPLLGWGFLTNSLDTSGELKMVQGVDKNAYLFFMLLTFVGMLAGLLLTQVWVHKRTILSLLTSRKKLDLNRILFSFGLWGGLMVVLQIIDYFIEPDYVFQFDAGKWLILVAISLLIIPLQTSFEEIFFRGYLQQMLGNLTRKPWIPLLVSSILFGSMHFMNPEVAKMGIGMAAIYYIGFGLVLGAITLLDEGLELALGFHAANNIFTSILVTFKESALQTDAMFIDMQVDYVTMLLLWVVAVVLYLIVIYRKYKLPAATELLQSQPPTQL